MYFKIKAYDLMFDRSAYKRDMDTGAKRLLQAMTQVFLDTVIQHIPVDTGMAIATMIPVARAMNIALEIERGPNKKARGKKTAFNYDKSAEAGSTKARVHIVEGPSIYRVTWSGHVFHFLINEIFRVKNNDKTPWKSIQKGLNAVEIFFHQRSREFFPERSTYLKATMVKT